MQGVRGRGKARASRRTESSEQREQGKLASEPTLVPRSATRYRAPGSARAALFSTAALAPCPERVRAAVPATPGPPASTEPRLALNSNRTTARAGRLGATNAMLPTARNGRTQNGCAPSLPLVRFPRPNCRLNPLTLAIPRLSCHSGYGRLGTGASGSAFSAATGPGTGSGSGAGFKTWWRRLSRWPQLDFELAVWQMGYLCIAPRRVYARPPPHAREVHLHP